METAGSETQKRPRFGVRIEAEPEDGYLVFKNYDYLDERYIIVGKLGQGSFGQVLQCWDDKSQRHVAVKVSRRFYTFLEAARQECAVLKCFANVSFARSCFVEMIGQFKHKEHICIVLEKLGPSLLRVLTRNGFTPFPIDQIQEFGAQILESAACMHQLGIIHTDLKPDNVVLVSSETKRYSTSPRDFRFLPKCSAIKLIDFGSTVFGNRTHFHIASTRNFRAPEVILGLGWTYPCDMWSIGSLLIELSTGCFLFNTDNDLEHLAMMEKVLGPLPLHIVERAQLVSDAYFSQCRLNLRTVSAERRAIIESLCSLEELVSEHVESSRSSSFVDLLKGLLKYDPNERLTARKALDHPFFQNPT